VRLLATERVASSWHYFPHGFTFSPACCISGVDTQRMLVPPSFLLPRNRGNNEQQRADNQRHMVMHRRVPCRQSHRAHCEALLETEIPLHLDSSTDEDSKCTRLTCLQSLTPWKPTHEHTRMRKSAHTLQQCLHMPIHSCHCTDAVHLDRITTTRQKTTQWYLQQSSAVWRSWVRRGSR
jgi:cell division protein FtsN